MSHRSYFIFLSLALLSASAVHAAEITGLYNQNDSGEADDFAQATYYELQASHHEYDH